MIRRYIGRTLALVALLFLFGAGVGLVLFQANGGKLLSIQSGSMKPAMNQGGLVGVTPVSEADLRVGDVITFINPADKNTTITHRVAALSGSAGQSITTKGDANLAADVPISDALLIGRKRFYVPFLGSFLDFVRQPIGLLLLIYIPALAVIAAEIRRLAAYYKAKEPYVLPEFLARKKAKPAWNGRAMLVSLAMLPVLAAAIPARAALSSVVTLGGSTITTASDTSVPTPDPPALVSGTVSLRRVFVVCAEGQGTATHLHIILYNSSRLDADVSGWGIRSSNEIILTLPNTTVIRAHSTSDIRLPLPEDISYASGSLTLHNQDDEQISRITWEPNTRAERDCRITSGLEVSDEVTEDSRALTEDRN